MGLLQLRRFLTGYPLPVYAFAGLCLLSVAPGLLGAGLSGAVNQSHTEDGTTASVTPEQETRVITLGESLHHHWEWALAFVLGLIATTAVAAVTLHLNRRLAASKAQLAAELRERARTERSLRETQERFRLITTSARDAILMLDAHGNTIFWNKAAERIFGYSKEEILGRNLHELLAPPRYLEAHQQAFPVSYTHLRAHET